ncbi:glycoside hydrolase family 2 protein [Microlunatus sp. GCM10028923]|uniref:glycoside hydrolase family 2 protein n=1 Tax=Microlunatus sp. GCM10028923 TaxID=3273400 RepID=UPI0036074C3E
MTYADPVHTDLHDGWSVRAASHHAPIKIIGRDIPATVPGCVHTDLLTAGLIPDPFVDDNEALLKWIGLTDWEYRTSFEWTPNGHARHDLVCHGLDTVATVRLNGRIVLESANQHRSYRVDVRDDLVAGRNEIVVTFASPVRYANAMSLEYGARPRPYPSPYEAIRKSACSFGWDWGIAAPSSGIWRPIRLESWSNARIAEVRLRAEPDAGGGLLSAEVDIERDTAGIVAVGVAVGGGAGTAAIPEGASRAVLEVRVPEVELWWPAGYGAQPLYDVSIVLAEDGDDLDGVSRRVGFRKATWNTEPDAHGTPFELFVNGRSVYVKGVNWIPDDAFVTRVNAARYRTRLEQAQAAGVNLIRVWGGGIYESDDFFDLCDELGLLSWQDFLFSCAAYPEEEPLRAEIESEARENAVRLSHHPSLVLFSGNNETLLGFDEWGWQTRLDGRTWGSGYYFDLLPRILAEAAPAVPYIPGSPFSPGERAANDEAHGPVHLWKQWNERDWLTYRDHEPRFVAEFGWQGPPTWTTLRGAISDHPLTPESPGMIVHQKAAEGNDKLSNGLIPHTRVPDAMDAWHWAMQWNQAKAIGCALEHFRSLAPRNAGAVVWQLNDCWPATSWAAIDSGGRLKPLWYAISRAFRPRLVTIQPRSESLAVVLANDSDQVWGEDLVFERRDFDGSLLASAHASFTVPPRGTVAIDLPGDIAHAVRPDRELVVASAADERGIWFFAEPRTARLEPAKVRVTERRVNGSTDVTVTAVSLVVDLTLLVDKATPDAVTEEGFITLLPGEDHTFRVRHDGEMPAGVFTTADVLRTANELVAEDLKL